MLEASDDMLSFQCVQTVYTVGPPNEEARLVQQAAGAPIGQLGPLVIRPFSSLMISFLGYDPGKVSGLNTASPSCTIRNEARTPDAPLHCYAFGGQTQAVL